VVNGAQVRFNFVVKSGVFDGDIWRLHNNRKGEIATRYVVNCAGLYGDQLDKDLLGASEFTIKPRKGQFVVYDKCASSLLKSIILPVPTEHTKGVVLTRTVFGNLLAGPTAEEQKERACAEVSQKVLQSLASQAANMLPALKDIPVTAIYAGLRPASEHKEYRVFHYPEKHWITAGGIRSTGLTSALGLAAYIYKKYAETIAKLSGSDSSRSAENRLKKLTDPVCPQVQNLAEHLPRDWSQPGYEEIVCHCELVTKREIDRALSGPLSAKSLQGLKRRTRVTMGRCQGFYCSARLAEITEGRFQDNLAIANLNSDRLTK